MKTEKLSMAISEWIFPSNIYCIACGNLIDSSRPYALCDTCMEEILWNTGPTCAKCGKALGEDSEGDFCGGQQSDDVEDEICSKAQRGDSKGELCNDCKEVDHKYGRGYSCVTYSERVRDIVRDMKYRDKPYYAAKIGDIMCDRLVQLSDPETGELPEWDALVPVPMNESKERKRGYNQAQVIAAILSKKLAIPCNSEILHRKNATAAMSSLGKGERRINIGLSIEAVSAACERTEIRGKRLLLIDDVYTTGSTADACAEALLLSGAKSADVFCFASGSDYKSKL